MTKRKKQSSRRSLEHAEDSHEPKRPKIDSSQLDLSSSTSAPSTAAYPPVFDISDFDAPLSQDASSTTSVIQEISQLHALGHKHKPVKEAKISIDIAVQAVDYIHARIGFPSDKKNSFIPIANAAGWITLSIKRTLIPDSCKELVLINEESPNDLRCLPILHMKAKGRM